MILELAERVEATTCDPLREDRASWLYQRPPGTRISPARVRVEALGNDRVPPGAQHDSQAFPKRRQPRGVVHQGRLKSVIILNASCIVEEWIGWGRGIEKKLVASNRAMWIEPNDADSGSRGENCRNVAGRMHREVNHGPSWRRHVGLHGVAIALQCRQRALWTVLKDGVKPLLKQHDVAACGMHLCDCLTSYCEIHETHAGGWQSFCIPAGNEKASRQTE